MIPFFKKSDTNKSAKKFDPRVLKKNDISLLILDERWNGLFANMDKPSEIVRCEEKIKELMKEQSNLLAERNELPKTKKIYMDKILKLTSAAYDEGKAEAVEEMQKYEKEIKKINQRISQIEERLDMLPDDIKSLNIELLGLAVNVVYLKIRGNQFRVKELDELIEKAREQLKAYIEEKEDLNKDQSDIYSYFHDLLGGEELEKLDNEFFK